METTLSSKGQIVIPRQIRQNHGWRPGISFTIIDRDNSLILQPVSTKQTTTLDDVIGCAVFHGQKKSLEEMDAAIREEAKQQAESWSR
jgi:AbrB family looped-hinge helix DNA binding protein